MTPRPRLQRDSSVFVAGHRGLVGSAVLRRLEADQYSRVLVAGRETLDLRESAAVDAWFEAQRPEFVVLCAARVGGIGANASRPADFIFDNLRIETNVVDAARRFGTRRLLFLGSSCIYPRECPQPIREEYLLTGPLEPTNEAYALAKIAGLKMCEASNAQYGTNFFAVMPTNLYGPNDNFDLATSHVLPALIRKFDEAARLGHPTVTLWGSGRPRREFLHVDDLADAIVHLLAETDANELLNVGTGTDLTIAELASLIAELTGFRGELVYDASKPDGTPRKVLDLARIEAFGWRARIGLRQGLEQTIAWYRSQLA